MVCRRAAPKKFSKGAARQGDVSQNILIRCLSRFASLRDTSLAPPETHISVLKPCNISLDRQPCCAIIPSYWHWDTCLWQEPTSGDFKSRHRNLTDCPRSMPRLAGAQPPAQLWCVRFRVKLGRDEVALYSRFFGTTSPPKNWFSIWLSSKHYRKHGKTWLPSLSPPYTSNQIATTPPEEQWIPIQLSRDAAASSVSLSSN